jgi:hypothetical protein
MWDYCAFLAWVSEERRDAIDPALREELQAWSDRLTDEVWGRNGPNADGWDGPGDEAVAALDGEGRVLAQRLHDNVGWDIEYVPLL